MAQRKQHKKLRKPTVVLHFRWQMGLKRWFDACRQPKNLRMSSKGTPWAQNVTLLVKILLRACENGKKKCPNHVFYLSHCFECSTSVMLFNFSGHIRLKKSDCGGCALDPRCPVTVCVYFCVLPSLMHHENPKETSVRELTFVRRCMQSGSEMLWLSTSLFWTSISGFCILLSVWNMLQMC